MSQDFAALAKSARVRAGITQSVLAEAVGLDHSYISKVERGLIPPPARARIIVWIDRLGIVDPQERIQYLLSAECLSYEDVAQAAEAADVNAMDQTKVLYQMIDEIKQSQDREEATNTEAMRALEEKVGPEAYLRLTQFAELLGKSNLDKDTANRVLDSTLNLAKTLLDAMATPASKEVPMNKKSN